MRDLGKASLNLFCSSFHSIPGKTLTLAQALDEIRGGRYQAEIRIVRTILQHEGKAAYDTAKARLDAYTFGGTFAPRRGIAHLQHHTGVVHGDLDHLSDVDAWKQAIAGDPRTVYVFTSPSGQGLKVGARVPIVTDDAAYKHAWHQVSVEYQQAYGGARGRGATVG
jgi:hypothetical protein